MYSAVGALEQRRSFCIKPNTARILLVSCTSITRISPSAGGNGADLPLKNRARPAVPSTRRQADVKQILDSKIVFDVRVNERDVGLY